MDDQVGLHHLNFAAGGASGKCRTELDTDHLSDAPHDRLPPYDEVCDSTLHGKELRKWIEWERGGRIGAIADVDEFDDGLETRRPRGSLSEVRGLNNTAYGRDFEEPFNLRRGTTHPSRSFSLGRDPLAYDHSIPSGMTTGPPSPGGREMLQERFAARQRELDAVTEILRHITQRSSPLESSQALQRMQTVLAISALMSSADLTLHDSERSFYQPTHPPWLSLRRVANTVPEPVSPPSEPMTHWFDNGTSKTFPFEASASDRAMPGSSECSANPAQSPRRLRSRDYAKNGGLPPSYDSINGTNLPASSRLHALYGQIGSPELMSRFRTMESSASIRRMLEAVVPSVTLLVATGAASYGIWRFSQGRGR